MDDNFVHKWTIPKPIPDPVLMFSSAFVVFQGIQCRLAISDGEKSQSSPGFFSMTVKFLRPEREGFDHYVNVRFSVSNRNKSHCRTIDWSGRFTSNASMHCIPNFAQCRILRDESLGFILDNHVTIVADMIFLKEQSGFFYDNLPGPGALVRRANDDGYETNYAWSIDNFIIFREWAKDRKTMDFVVKSPMFNIMGRECCLAIYPFGKSDRQSLGFFLESDDLVNISTSWFFTLCVLNKIEVMNSVGACYTSFDNTELGSDSFMLLRDLLKPDSGFLDGGGIKLLVKITLLKQNLLVRRQEVEDKFGMKLSGEAIVCTMLNFKCFLGVLPLMTVQSQAFSIGGCELYIGFRVDGDRIYGFLLCEASVLKMLEDIGLTYRIGIINTKEIERSVFGSSTFYKTDRIDLIERSTLSIEDSGFLNGESASFIFHIPHSDPLVFSAIRREMDDRDECISLLKGKSVSLSEDLKKVVLAKKESDRKLEGCAKVITLLKNELEGRPTKETLDTKLEEIMLLENKVEVLEGQLGDKARRLGFIRDEMERKNERAKEVQDGKLRSYQGEIRSLKKKIGQLEGQVKEKEKRIRELGQMKEKDKRCSHEIGLLKEKIQELEEALKVCSKESRGSHEIGLLKEKIQQLEEALKVCSKESRGSHEIGLLKEKIQQLEEALKVCQIQRWNEMSIHAPLYGIGLEDLLEKELETVVDIHVKGLGKAHDILQQKRREKSICES